MKKLITKFEDFKKVDENTTNDVLEIISNKQNINLLLEIPIGREFFNKIIGKIDLICNLSSLSSVEYLKNIIENENIIILDEIDKANDNIILEIRNILDENLSKKNKQIIITTHNIDNIPSNIISRCIVYKLDNQNETIKENNISESYEHLKNYMFFSNLETLKRKIDTILSQDFKELDSILDEHNWAQDHVTVAKDNINQVCDFLMNKDYSKDDK